MRSILFGIALTICVCTYAQAYIYSIEDEEFYPEIREKRSVQPGGPTFYPSGENWKFNPTVHKDILGNTRRNLDLAHAGQNHHIYGQYSEVVSGPDKSKSEPVYKIGGSFKFKRSVSYNDWVKNQPKYDPPKDDDKWKTDVDVSRDQKDNVKAKVGAEKKGDNYKIRVEATQVVDGPSRESKPNFHISGSYDWP